MLKRRVLARSPRQTTFETLAFSALCGLRSMAGPALLSRSIRRGGVPTPGGKPLETLRRLSPLLQVLMIGEMAADKAPFVPSRTSAGPLSGRAVSGALSAAVLFAIGRRGDKGAAALLGALSAVGAAYVGENLRTQGARKLGVPDPVLAVLEDGLVLFLGTRLLRGVASR